MRKDPVMARHATHKQSKPVDETLDDLESKPKVEPLLSGDDAAELEAIRKRLGERRHELATASMPDRYNTTDLADADWLLDKLSKALGVTEAPA
jgi:hypothetical protein